MNRSPNRNRLAAVLLAALALSPLPSGAATAANVSGLMPTAGTTSFSGTLAYQGQTRQYIVIRPLASVAGAPALFLLHPRDTTALQMANLSRAGRVAANYGAWVFLPQALNGQWHDDPSPTGPEAGYQDDVGFLIALMTQATSQYGIDTKRIYAAGYSSGGAMSQRLACERANRVAAVGSVAADLRRGLAAVCRPSLAVSVALMAGTADPVSPFNGDYAALSAADTAQFWATQDRCLGAVTTSIPPASGDPTQASLKRNIDCTAGTEVRLYTITNSGHTWPGSPFPVPSLGYTNQSVDATLELWKFFAGYRSP